MTVVLCVVESDGCIQDMHFQVFRSHCSAASPKLGWLR